jgi:hypothetical protein
MSTAAPSNALVATPITFTIQATDPDNDTLFYQIDWDADGVSDVRLPGSGYVASGVPMSTNNLWPSVGDYTLKARTTDQVGNTSDWTQHTIRIELLPVVPPQPLILTIQSASDLVRSGETTLVRVAVTANYVAECTVFGVAGGPIAFTHNPQPLSKTYSFPTDPLTAAQEVTARCLPNVPGFSLPEEKRSLRINVVPVYQET